MAMVTLLLGMALELLATMFGTTGKQLVSYSARLPEGARAKRIKASGLLITTLLGPVADAGAYALAPQSFIAPLSGLDVVWNTLSAPFTLGEQLTGAHVVGTVLVTTGATLTAVFGPHDAPPATLDVLRERFVSWYFLAYAFVFFGGLCVSMYVLQKHPKGSTSRARALALGGTAGCIAGNMSFLSSVLSALTGAIETGDWSAWKTPFPYVLALMAVAVAVSNIPFMSRALQEFEALFIVTIFEGSHIMAACVSGAVVNRDMAGAEWWRYCSYWASVLTIVAGLGAIQSTSAGAIQRQEQEQLAGPEARLPSDAPNSMCCPEGGVGQVVWASSFTGVGISFRGSVAGSAAGSFLSRSFRPSAGGSFVPSKVTVQATTASDVELSTSSQPGASASSGAPPAGGDAGGPGAG